MTAAGLVGRHPGDPAIRERTGCGVVAVDRGGEVAVEFDDDFRVAAGDAVYVFGTTQDVRRFVERVV